MAVFGDVIISGAGGSDRVASIESNEAEHVEQDEENEDDALCSEAEDEENIEIIFLNGVACQHVSYLNVINDNEI